MYEGKKDNDQITKQSHSLKLLSKEEQEGNWRQVNTFLFRLNINKIEI